MSQAALAKSQSVAPSQPAIVEPAGATTATPGFSLDGFLGMDATAATGTPGAFAVHLPDLGAVFKQTIAGAIDTVGRQPGSELELAATLRCPIYTGLFLAGNLSIKAARSATGVTATLAGGMGLSVGKEGLMADLLATASIQGEGADSTRAVEMLALAVEQYVRAVPNVVFVPFGRNIAIGVLLGLANAAGVSAGNFLADQIWGGGHADAIIAGMQDGEAAEITAGGTVGGGFDVPGGNKSIDIGGSLVAGVEGTSRTEKVAGAEATTTKSMAFINKDDFTLGPATGGIDIELQHQPVGSGTVTVTGKVVGDAALLGKMEPYMQFLVGAIGKTQAVLSSAPSSMAPSVGPASASLNAAREVLPTVVLGASGMVLTELRKLGADVKAGVEVNVEIDLAARSGKVTFAYVAELEQKLGLGNEGSVTQKQQLGPELPFTIPR